MPNNQFMMIGLPASGKTSFLAAFWFMVDQLAAECGFAIDKLVGDTKYLNQIRDAWLQLKPVPRNLVDVEKLAPMSLKRQLSGAEVTLQFPDLSGEAFRQQWSKRQLTTGYDRLLRASEGALLFISPDVVKPHRIDTVEEIAKLLPDPEPEATPTPKKTKDWDIEKAPTQVQLVELLQAIASRDYFQQKFRLAIIVSAYDRLLSTFPKPETFVANELPLLNQYLSSNSNLFEVMPFGLSAQGGIYASPLLLPEMIADSKDIANKLLGPKDGFYAWLSTQLESNTIAALTGSKPNAEVTQLLVDDLNRLLGKIDFYDAARFASIQLREETVSDLEDFLEKEVKDATDIRFLNRMLLEDAFPKSISKKRQNQKNHKHLANLPAAKRVVICGETVKNKHDITEPIQWLMS